MKILIFVLISMFIASAIYSQDQNNCSDYLDLPTYSDNGVTYEKVSDSTNFFRLYNDNIIFKIGKKYLYSIDIEKNSKKYFFDYSDITETSTDSSYAFLLYSIDTVKNSFYLNYHDQSPYFVKYFNSKLNSLGYEYTGCIENKTNFWIHPFNTNRFRATYRLPWPFFVNSKNQIGNKYSWEHKIPDFYSFAEISPFKGVKNLDFEYEIINIFSKNWNGKYVDVYKIRAFNKSSEEDEYSEFEFTCEYGFLSIKHYFDSGYIFTFSQIQSKDMTKEMKSKLIIDKH